MRIADRVFVVTGAGSGIGREVALDLLERGGIVAAVDRREEGLAETARLADGPATRLTTHTVDITDTAAVDRLVADVVAAHGRVDGLLHIAGIIQRFVPLEELSIDEIERVMNVNFWGTVYMNKAFLPALRARPESALLNVASMGALVPVPGQAAYGASKGAVKLLTEALYAELQDTNVAVSVVFPGGVGTHITENSGVAAPTVRAGKTAKVTSAPDAARQIVDGVESGKFRIIIGSDAKMLDRMSRLSPRRAITMVAKRMKALLE